MDRCHFCGNPSKGICDDCRAWKEQRIKDNECPCDICYQVEQYQKAVEVFCKSRSIKIG